MSQPGLIYTNQTGNTGGGGGSITLPNAMLAGDMLLVWIGLVTGGSASINPPTMTGETFALIPGASGSGGSGTIACYAIESAVGGQTVVNFPAQSDIWLGTAIQIRGQAQSNPIDATGYLYENPNATNVSSGSTTNAQDLVIAFYHDPLAEGNPFSNGTNATSAFGSGGNCLFYLQGSGGFHNTQFLTAYALTNATGVQSFSSISNGNGDHCNQAIICIKGLATGWSLVQVQTPAYVDAGSQNITFNSCIAGDLLVLFAYSADNSLTMSVTNDTNGNSWASPDGQITNASGGGSIVFLAIAKAGSTTVTVSFNTGSDFINVAGFEISGLTASPLDVSSQRVSPNVTDIATTVPVSTTTVDMLMAFAVDPTSAAYVTAGATPWVMMTQDSNFYSGVAISYDGGQGMPVGSYQANLVMNTNAGWNAHFFAFGLPSPSPFSATPPSQPSGQGRWGGTVESRAGSDFIA